MLTLADKQWRGVGEMLTMADKGGRGSPDPTFMAAIICEQPFTKSKDQLEGQVVPGSGGLSRILYPGCGTQFKTKKIRYNIMFQMI